MDDCSNEDRSLTASIPATTIQTLEVELIPAAEWAEAKGDLPSAPEVEQGKERFVTEALTETGIPCLG